MKSKHNKSRRAFLVSTVAGAGSVATGAGLAQPAPQAEPAADHTHDNGGKLRAFLNQDDSAAIEAFTERLMPGAPGEPGARDAGVLNYIDLALAGAYADQGDFYRRGLAQLDAYSVATHGAPFRRLDAGKQDAVITALEGGKATGFT